MAKTKASKPASKAPAAPPEEAKAEAKSNVMSIRGTAAWKAWLDRYAARRRVTATALIDQVLAEAAQRDGFEMPPPRF